MFHVRKDFSPYDLAGEAKQNKDIWIKITILYVQVYSTLKNFKKKHLKTKEPILCHACQFILLAILISLTILPLILDGLTFTTSGKFTDRIKASKAPKLRLIGNQKQKSNLQKLSTPDFERRIERKKKRIRSLPKKKEKKQGSTP